MKKASKFFVVVSLLVITLNANAQIKVHSDGQISLGSLGKIYGLQVHPDGYTFFANPNTISSIVTMTKVTNTNYRSWLVRRDNMNIFNRFYVDGLGNVYRYASYSLSEPQLQNNVYPIVNPTSSLKQINGYYYTIEENKNDKASEKRNVGISAADILKVIPEAIEITEEGNMYINYDALTVFLIEAVKEQQKEIEFLRGKLKENGLLK